MPTCMICKFPYTLKLKDRTDWEFEYCSRFCFEKSIKYDTVNMKIKYLLSCMQVTEKKYLYELLTDMDSVSELVNKLIKDLEGFEK